MHNPRHLGNAFSGAPACPLPPYAEDLVASHAESPSSMVCLGRLPRSLLTSFAPDRDLLENAVNVRFRANSYSSNLVGSR